MLIRTCKAIPRETMYSRTATHDKIREGLLPPLVKLGPRASAFVLEELREVQKARIAGASDDEVKVLVRRLVEQRPHMALHGEAA